MYSKKIVSVLDQCLEQNCWPNFFDAVNGYFKCRVRVGRSARVLSVMVDVREDRFCASAIAPFRANPNDELEMANVSEYLCRINSVLVFGKILLDFDDGKIFSSGEHICIEKIPTVQDVSEVIMRPIQSLNAFLDGIESVINCDKTPRQAFCDTLSFLA